MLFSNKVSKIGKGENISVFMPDKNTIYVYFYNSGVMKRTLIFENEKIKLEQDNNVLSCHKIIQLSNNLFLSRFDKNLRIYSNE